ncbi:OLC1v1010596C1 [Oldenlandia corymbosa var. corymbosa]|uniref:OLC1v1010596C1 n=1 Tax=Oldenlandia corymbosa var. corymbosa TaxID=529605 RepID=A0AAV1DRR3_OLDCO|nr:OLC1v1010596C1 [Oldenlandia corymbosa var. corymbosa]
MVRVMMLENITDFSPPPPQFHVDSSSRPSLGFPLGTALLLIIIFSLSGIFSCCYHWDKLRSFRRSFADADADEDDDTTKAKLAHMDLKPTQSQSLPVLMPGDDVPKFIAMPCPCAPPKLENIVVEVPEKKPPAPTPKPPTMAVPLY